MPRRWGSYTLLRARADGPADGELVLLLHGFPETSYEWREQLPALGAAGYRAVAPDQRGYAPGARPDGRRRTTRSSSWSPTWSGSPMQLGADRFHLVGHDWGAVGRVVTVAGRHGDRLRTLTVVSTPHPAPFAGADAGDGGSDQRERSSYMLVFRRAERGGAVPRRRRRRAAQPLRRAAG